MKPLAVLGFEPAYTRLDATGADFDKYYSRMGGGTLLKTTRPGRFAELDAMLVAELGRFAPGRLIRVHDVAASSAITSIELLETLRARGPANVRASDYYDALYLLDGAPFSFVFDADMAPLQATVGRAGISAQHGPLRRVLAPFWASAIARQSEARRVSLFHPRALAAAAAIPGSPWCARASSRPKPDLTKSCGCSMRFGPNSAATRSVPSCAPPSPR